MRGVMLRTESYQRERDTRDGEVSGITPMQ
jgi:hypothetical protein